VLLAQAPAQATGPDSEATLLETLKQAESRHGVDSAELLPPLRAVAEFYGKGNRPRDAIAVWERVMRIQERTAGADSLDVAASLAQSVEQYMAAGRYADGVPLAERCLAIREKALAPDHPDVMNALASLGGLHFYLTRAAVALPLFQRALAIAERTFGPDHPEVAAGLNNLALVYEDGGLYEQALPLFQRALAIHEKTHGPDDPRAGSTLNNLAWLYYSMGQAAQGIPLAQRSVALAEKEHHPDHPSVATSLNNLANMYREVGQYAAALPLLLRAVAIREKTQGPDHPDVAITLNNLANLYRDLGRYEQAIPLAERSLAIRERALGLSTRSVALALNNVAALYTFAGRYADALTAYERAVAVAEQALGPGHPIVAYILHNLAGLHRSMRNPALAQPFAERALAVGEKALGPEHGNLSRYLRTLAAVYLDQGDAARALPLVVRAEHVAAVAGSAPMQWLAQDELRRAFARSGNADLAIFWGKQSVNTIQGLRAGLTNLERDLQQSYLGDKRRVYTGLADLLIDAGRLAEAQQVLAMLKEEELHDFLRRDAGEDRRTARAAFVGTAEREAETRWRELSGHLAELGRERGALQRQSRLGLSDTQKARLSEVEEALRQANRRYDTFIAGLADEFARAAAARLKDLGARQLDNLVTLQDTLREVGGDTVLLHYVVTDNRVAIIVTTADVQVARESAIGQADLNRRVQALRVALRDRGDVLPHARALYELLVAPVAADLVQARTKRLALSLDGALRYVPFAVLHDGERYLIERYALSVYTEAARANLRRSPSARWAMTGLGLTRAVPGFGPLPAVRAELEGIRGRVLPGEIYLDEQFTANRLADSLLKPVPVLHIASHFSFRPGTDADSFLVLGDGSRMSLQEMRERRLRFGTVELLTLSACDTAMGGGTNENGAEVEGFGALAQRQGAQAVLATLWPVADHSTGVLMREMYAVRQRQAGLAKAEALRRVQLAFLRGEAPGGSAALKRAYAHPFFWAPFILMGNWL
jgi:CHAT domain-containing protein